jgi:hypothetical protein
MEGFLSMYIGLLTRWKDKYFVLHENVLSWANFQGDKIQGSVHLGVSTIKVDPKDTLSITVLSGNSEIILRAKELKDKLQWVSKMQEAQETCYSEEQRTSTLSNMRNEYESGFTEKGNLYKLSPEIRNLLYGKETSVANEKLSDVWLLQARFKEKLFNLQMKFREGSDEYNLCEELEEIGDNMKDNVTQVVKLMESEKGKLHQIVGYIEEKCDQIERNIRGSAKGGPSFAKKKSANKYQSPTRGHGGGLDTDELNKSLGKNFMH